MARQRVNHQEKPDMNKTPFSRCDWIALAIVASLALCRGPVVAGDDLPAGEIPFKAVDDERPRHMKLLSGKLFKIEPLRIQQRGHSYTSGDGGKTWDRGGLTIHCDGLPGVGGSMTFQSSAIQVQNGKYRGRIVLPYYLEMDGDHPDYDRKQRGGYALFKGEKIVLETHTHVPEMAGTFFLFSDDEGQTWKQSKGFLVGYFKDGHMGHMSCEEPTVAELKDGRLLCYIRSTCGRILKSYSSDGGKSWTKVELTGLAMSNSPAMLKRLPMTGDLVLVWNQMSAEEIRKGYRRGRLTIAISKDDGQTWINRRNLEVSPGCDPNVTNVEPPPLQAMVRGGSGPDEILSELPDGFTHYHYATIFLSEGNIFIKYSVSPRARRAESRWRVFPIEWLYEPKGE